MTTRADLTPPSEEATTLVMTISRRRYGRRLEAFAEGEVFEHPWEVTVDEGARGLVAASFLDATPTWASRRAARELGLADRPFSPAWLLQWAVSFSVHDVSEQAIANLAYLDARFPDPCFVGDTLRASSVVLGVRPVSAGDKGVVHLRTSLLADDGRVVCCLERKALVRAGGAPLGPSRAAPPPPVPAHRFPQELVLDRALSARWSGFDTGFFEDLEPGAVLVHDVGRTVTEAEHVMLTSLARNSHPLHTDEVYCQGMAPGAGRPGSPPGSFARTRVVYGGLVIAWVLALASRDTAANALWEVGLDEGAHPRGVLAGDTLYAASKVLSREPLGPHAGLVTLRVVGLRNVGALGLLERGADLFTPELGKEDGRVPEKVVEVTRTLLVRRRPGSSPLHE